MVGELGGRVALVTGAAGGMGAAIATVLAAAGAAVVASDIAAARGDEVVAGIRAGGGQAVFQQADVSSSRDVEELIRVTERHFGRVDCAVNAAAIEFEQHPLAECSDEDFDRMIAVTLRSVFLCMKHEILAMRRHGDGGSIVNIASTNSYRPQHNQPAYTAAKHGVLGLTRSAAIDYGREGIRVNAICPGAIDTPMLHAAMERKGGHPETVARRLSVLQRFGQPDEVASAALWLCSDASSFTTGHALAVDGGFLAR